MKKKSYNLFCIIGLIMCFGNIALKIFSGNFTNIHISILNTFIFMLLSIFLLSKNTNQPDNKNADIEEEIDKRIQEYEKIYQNDDE